MEVLEQHVHTPGMPSEQRLALMEGMDSWLFTVVSAQTKPLCSGQRSYLLVKGYQLLTHHREKLPYDSWTGHFYVSLKINSH